MLAFIILSDHFNCAFSDVYSFKLVLRRSQVLKSGWLSQRGPAGHERQLGCILSRKRLNFQVPGMRFPAFADLTLVSVLNVIIILRDLMPNVENVLAAYT